MLIKPDKSTRIISEHLNMPCGISVSWQKSLPFRLFMKAIEISDDEEFVRKEIRFNTFPRI